MPTTSDEEKRFLEAAIGKKPLENFINWVRANLKPQDVFEHSVLRAWAEEYGFKPLYKDPK